MKRFLKSFLYAIRGIRFGVIDQPNLKIMIGVSLLVIIAGFYFRITSVEWCVLLLCIGLVVGLEMLNTAIESLVDLVTRERLPLAGRIKDIAAGAVMFVSTIAVIIGAIIFRKHIM